MHVYDQLTERKYACAPQQRVLMPTRWRFWVMQCDSVTCYAEVCAASGRSWGAPAQPSAAEAVRDAQQAAWERLYLSRDMHDERNRGLLWLAVIVLIALWATGVLNPPAHDPLDAGA